MIIGRINELRVNFVIAIDSIFVVLTGVALRPPDIILLSSSLLLLLIFHLDVTNFKLNYSLTDHAQPLPSFNETQLIIYIIIYSTINVYFNIIFTSNY